jgi:hypothetical protein
MYAEKFEEQQYSFYHNVLGFCGWKQIERERIGDWYSRNGMGMKAGGQFFLAIDADRSLHNNHTREFNRQPTIHLRTVCHSEVVRLGVVLNYLATLV